MGSQQGPYLISQESAALERQIEPSGGFFRPGQQKEVSMGFSHAGNNYANSSDGVEFSFKAQEKRWERYKVKW